VRQHIGGTKPGVSAIWSFSGPPLLTSLKPSGSIVPSLINEGDRRLTWWQIQ